MIPQYYVGSNSNKCQENMLVECLSKFLKINENYITSVNGNEDAVSYDCLTCTTILYDTLQSQSCHLVLLFLKC